MQSMEGLNELIKLCVTWYLLFPSPAQGWDRIPGGDCELGPSLEGWAPDSGLFICGLLTHVSEKAGRQPLSRCPQAGRRGRLFPVLSTVCEYGLDPGTSPLLHM